MKVRANSPGDALRDGMIRLAAMHERDSALWEQRFQGVFTSGLLRLRGAPGKEFALRIDPVRAAAPQARMQAYCLATVLPALRSGCAVGLDLSGQGTATVTRWWQCLKHLTKEHGLPFDALLFSVNAGDIDCGRWAERLTADAPVGARIAIRYGVGDAVAQSLAWSSLVATSYRHAAMQPVPVSALRPLSVLHNAEKGQAVMPLTLFDVPAATAWLMLDIDARCLGHPARVRRQLAVCLRFADNLIDALEWPRSALRLDALLNRRIAVQLTHIGALLVQQGIRPAEANGFRRLQRWLGFIRDCFVHESRQLARRRGPFPELCASDLFTSLMPRYGVADTQRLLRNRALRHRHLFALSPFELFPDTGAATADWVQLLPAIACADAIAMTGPDVRDRLSMPEWSRLLQLIAATAARNAGNQKY